MHLAVDAVGIHGGGGLTILRGFLEYLSLRQPGNRYTVFVGEAGIQVPRFPACDVRVAPFGSGRVSRIAWQQVGFPIVASRIKADVVLSLANAGSVVSLRPQCVYCQQILPFDRSALSVFPFSTRMRALVQKVFMLASALRSDRVIVQTKTMRDALLASALSSRFASKIYVIPPRVAGGRSACSFPRIGRVPHVGEGSLKIAYVSSLDAHKNHINLVRAIALLKRRFPAVKLLLTTCKYSCRNESLFAELVSTARDLGITDNVVFLGLLSAADVEDLLSDVDVLAFPSLAESFGLPLVEAMAAGVPVAASDRSYAREVVGDAGVYFDPLDPADIARVLGSVLGSNTLASRLRDKGFARSAMFDAETTYGGMYRVLQSLAC